jgi:hypothetical protein
MHVCAVAAVWPAVTSHALLEQAGFIHEIHADHHHAHDHDQPHDHDYDGGSHEHLQPGG